MNKNEKKGIITDIILRAEKAKYESGELDACIRDIKALIRNCIGKDSPWLDEIGSIRYGPIVWTEMTPNSYFEECWESGRKTFVGVLYSILSEINLYGQGEDSYAQNVDIKKVFIVHGHDETMKLAVNKTLSDLGLFPIILHEQPNSGKTIIEKFEYYSEDIGFAIVLLSPDDTVYVDGKQKARARQNVIFELGYFVAKLGRHNVVALYNNNGCEIELPNDISGVIYESYDKPDGTWRLKVVQELRASGYEVDANQLK